MEQVSFSPIHPLHLTDILRRYFEMFMSRCTCGWSRKTVPICTKRKKKAIRYIYFVWLIIFFQAYGEAGVTRLIRILDREMRTGMALLGAATLNDLKPEYVRTYVNLFYVIILTDILMKVEKVNFQPAQMQAKL